MSVQKTGHIKTYDDIPGTTLYEKQQWVRKIGPGNLEGKNRIWKLITKSHRSRKLNFSNKRKRSKKQKRSKSKSKSWIKFF